MAPSQLPELSDHAYSCLLVPSLRLHVGDIISDIGSDFKLAIELP